MHVVHVYMYIGMHVNHENDIGSIWHDLHLSCQSLKISKTRKLTSHRASFLERERVSWEERESWAQRTVSFLSSLRASRTVSSLSFFFSLSLSIIITWPTHFFFFFTILAPHTRHIYSNRIWHISCFSCLTKIIQKNQVINWNLMFLIFWCLFNNFKHFHVSHNEVSLFFLGSSSQDHID